MTGDSRSAVVVGAGPAGLMAAEVLAGAGLSVTVHEKMPSAGRKFLMAGRGGLNLTHSESFDAFLDRYAQQADRLRPILAAFPPSALVEWAEGLGQPTFVGSSGRVFPRAMKASPLLRAWLSRLGGLGVELRTRSTWKGWTDDGALMFENADGQMQTTRPDVTILALGGASWPNLGSDGAWLEVLTEAGAPSRPLRPANCGIEIGWSEVFRDRFAGHPLKAVALWALGRTVRGEAVVTRGGLEGGAVYALSGAVRDALEAGDDVHLEIDLRSDIPVERLQERLTRTRAGDSTASRLRKALSLSPLEIGLLREAHGVKLPTEPDALARAVKASRLAVAGVRPLARAISTAGGVSFEALDEGLMLRARPGVFLAGEMLDWEAPTGGYLLQASFATGAWAAHAALARDAAT